MSFGYVEVSLAFCIACFVSYSEIIICNFVNSFFLSITLLLCIVSELFVEVLGFYQICSGVKLLNLIEILHVCIGFLLFSAAIVFQNLQLLLWWFCT